jgi:hypothetical protein
MHPQTYEDLKYNMKLYSINKRNNIKAIIKKNDLDYKNNKKNKTGKL